MENATDLADADRRRLRLRLDNGRESSSAGSATVCTSRPATLIDIRHGVVAGDWATAGWVGERRAAPAAQCALLADVSSTSSGRAIAWLSRHKSSPARPRRRPRRACEGPRSSSSTLRSLAQGRRRRAGGLGLRPSVELVMTDPRREFPSLYRPLASREASAAVVVPVRRDSAVPSRSRCRCRSREARRGPAVAAGSASWRCPGLYLRDRRVGSDRVLPRNAPRSLRRATRHPLGHSEEDPRGCAASATTAWSVSCAVTAA